MLNGSFTFGVWRKWDFNRILEESWSYLRTLHLTLSSIGATINPRDRRAISSMEKGLQLHAAACIPVLSLYMYLYTYIYV